MKRLQKVIAHAGITSRQKAGEFILAERVKVDGQVVRELGIRVGKHDTVEVGEAPIYQEEYGYYLLYKPKGAISAVADDKGREVVTDLLSMVKERICPVGRLDYDTSRILLLTNDGGFARRLTHPKHEVGKVCVTKVKGIATKSMFAPLTKGIEIEGRETSPAKFQILSVGPKTSRGIVELTIHEERNHQVKDILQTVGLPVQKLEREKYGDLTSRDLRSGDYRELSRKKVSSLLNHSKWALTFYKC